MNGDQHHGDSGQPAGEDPAGRPLPGLGPLESAIMLALWETPEPVKVAEVTERLAYPRHPAYTTVMTVLTVLCRKGLVRRHRDSRVWFYAPALSRDEYLTQRIRDLVVLARDPETVVRNALGSSGKGWRPGPG